MQEHENWHLQKPQTNKERCGAMQQSLLQGEPLRFSNKKTLSSGWVLLRPVNKDRTQVST